ncbi:MAG: ribosome biogenesis GTPase Der [Bacteroidetes bacterium]|nr:ribosome biogenesis GTPase Der [Bacteroidota bacterium]
MKMPIVAIIGLPNVGKSTLFNRIVGSRKAIVHDEPGVTRDRHYSTADWNGKNFVLIDTGGYIPESKNEIELAMREQCVIAIEEADLILYVVDALQENSIFESVLTNQLRKTEKPIILVVNKVDDKSKEGLINDFYKIGFKNVIPISALGGRNIGDFLDSIINLLPKNEAVEEQIKSIKLAVIGKPNVGKSSFVNTLIGKKRTIVSSIPGTTRDSINTNFIFNSQQLTLIDTAGLVKRKRLKSSVEFYSTLRTIRSIEECDVAIIIFDATEELEKQNLQIVSMAAEQRKGIIIAVNKWDLIEKDTHTSLEFEKSLRKRLRFYNHIPIIFISALKNLRIQKAIQLSIDVYNESNKRVSTSQLNSKLIADIQRNPPSTKSGRDVKLNYVTQTKVAHPLFVFFANEPQMISDNYKNFLENRIRHHFGFDGVQIALLFKKKRKD